MLEEMMKELDAAYAALDKLNRHEACSWNGVCWDGDEANSYAWDCVYLQIWKDIDSLTEEIKSRRNIEGL